MESKQDRVDPKGKVKRRKIYKERTSLYDRLGEQYPGLYAVFKVQFFFFVVYILARDSIRAGRFYIDFSQDQLVLGGLRDWAVFLALELVQLLLFLLMYIVFRAWQWSRKWLGRVLDVLYLTTYITYVCGSALFVWYAIHASDIATVLKLIAFIEQIRLSMKSYSFIRENAYKVLYPWHKDDESGPAVWYAGQMSPQVGSFSQYLYFLFAPTLLYRDHYPRNQGSIKWKNVFLYGVQFLGAYFVARVMFLEVLFPVSMRWDSLLLSFSLCLLASPLMNFLASILVLNAWFNFTAELTRFADREFYQYWWSPFGYSEYYRLWNIPVYDYLFSYILLELRPWVPYRPLAALPALVLSSILHDFLAGVSMGFFSPIFIIMFATMGGIVMVSGVRFSKTMTFMLTCLGTAIFESFFYTEIAARRYCPDHNLGPFELQAVHCFFQYNNVTILS